ncbi:MAG: lysostaphin resistance A-like protein [Actinomycetota bacterium]
MDDLRPPPPPVPQLPEPELAELEPAPWRAREAVFIVLLAFATTLFFSLVLFAAMGVRSGTRTETTYGLLTGIIAEALFGVWVLIWIKIRYQRGRDSLGLRRREGDLGAGLLAGLLGLGASLAVSQIVFTVARQVTEGPVKTPEQIPNEVGGAGQVLLAVVLAVVAAPIAEEILFRGFLYQALRKWKGVTGGAVISAIIFGLSHTDFAGLSTGIRDKEAAQIVSSLLIVLPTLVLGVILARLFERRRSLVAPIVAHSVYNTIGVILILTTN